MLQEIAQHLTTHMVDNWTGCPLIYDNQPEVDFSDLPVWARFAVRMGDQNQVSIGQMKQTDQKLRLILQIFVKRGDGSGAAFYQAQAFTELFRYYRFNSSEFSIEGRAPQTQTFDEEDWFQLNVSIPMTATFTV